MRLAAKSPALRRLRSGLAIIGSTRRGRAKRPDPAGSVSCEQLSMGRE